MAVNMPPTNVSPGQIVQSSQGFYDEADTGDALVADSRFQRSGLGNFWDPNGTGDETARQWHDDLWAPTWDGFEGVLGEYGTSLRSLGGQVVTTGALYSASNLAATENVNNVNNVHVTG
jgi:hypothetical protein